MKISENLIGKIVIAAAIIIAGKLIAEAIMTAGGDIGSQIAAALNVIAAQK